MLAGCAALVVAAPPASASIEIRSQTLSPKFRPAGRDYVVECAERVALRVFARGESEARVGKDEWSPRTQRVQLALTPGRSVRVHTRRVGRRTRTYSIRCLPQSFTPYEFKRSRKREPAAPFYLVTPNSTGISALSGGHAVVYTRWGAPIWWYQDSPSPFDAAVLSDGTFVWAHFGGGFGTDPAAAYYLRRPSGRVKAKIQTIGSPTDHHDFQVNADGNYMVLTYRPRSGVDTSEFNGDDDATIYDSVVQVLTPRGELVSEWSTADHIALDETPEYRWQGDEIEDEPYDTTHANAIEPLANGDFLISLRHTDAVYRVDEASGAIEWKLGGTPTPNSLRVENDPLSYPVRGPHDIRWLGKGEISLHDNRTGGGDEAPRVTRYRIADGAATLVESFTDPAAPSSFCCGSARLLGDHWLVAWGGNPLVAEYDARHRRVFALHIGGSGTSYRAIAIDGELTARQLRHGMDLQARRAR